MPRVPLAVAAVIVLALVLRAPLVDVAPVSGEAQRGWSVTSAAFGSLTTIAVVCFALAAPLASFTAQRLGLDCALLIAAAGVVATTGLRSLGGFWVAVAATVLLGVSIAFGNVLIPSVIRRDVPEGRRAAATGVYTVALNAGTLAATAATVPLAGLLGWRAAITVWALPGLLAVLAWTWMMRSHARPRDAAPARARTATRQVGAVRWLIAGAFAAQLAAYYSVTVWLPNLLDDRAGLGAGAAALAASVFQAGGIVGGILTPFAIRRFGLRGTVVALTSMFVLLPVVLLTLPGQYVAAAAIGGVAQGGVFTAIFAIVATVASDEQSTAALSAFAQMIGYLAAALFPPAIGALRTATGSWTSPLLVVTGLTVLLLVFSTAASKRSTRRQPAEE